MLCSCYTESVAWLCLDNFFEHFIGVTALVIAIWLSYADDMHQVTWYFNQYSSYMISILFLISSYPILKKFLLIYQVSNQAPTKSPSTSAFSVFLHVSRALLKFSSCWEIISINSVYWFTTMLTFNLNSFDSILYPFRFMWSISCLIQ